MSWENYGKWHIDHIIPRVYFNIQELGDEEFQKCWSLENLRPLWAKDNIMKKDKIEITKLKFDEQTNDFIEVKEYISIEEFKMKTTRRKL